jgi:uncharacterized damage-inducible protein DinB
MTSVLLELFKHKTWATLGLIEFCQSLEAEHLEATQPGTFGSVRATLTHLVNADSNYYRRLTDEQVGPEVEASASLDTFAERVRLLDPLWARLLDDASLPDRPIPSRWGTTDGVALLAQSIHHADDHRTQVLTILGARGLEVPELDIWAYGEHAGFVRPDPRVTAG